MTALPVLLLALDGEKGAREEAEYAAAIDYVSFEWRLQAAVDGALQPGSVGQPAIVPGFETELEDADRGNGTRLVFQGRAVKSLPATWRGTSAALR